jgi:hypothetical protein
MKKIKIMLAFAGFVIVCLPATAQKGNLKLELNYNYSVPVSGFKSDLISNNSPRGFMGALMYPFSDKLSAGVEFGFQDYYQKYPRRVYTIGKSQDVSAVLSNSIQTTPLMIKAKYFLLNATFLKPYLSLAGGANMVSFNQYLGEFGSGQTKVKLRAEGGAGLFIPFTRSGSTGINISAAYNYSPYHTLGYKDLNTINFQAGVTIDLR